MVPISSIYQLGSNPKAVSRLADASFQNGPHIKLFSNHPQINVLAFEGKRRSPCRHVKVLNLREGANDFFAHSIRENLIFRVRAKTQERQHRN
jgi:hypothetical protein